MLSDEELFLVRGGGNTSTLLNAIARAVNTLYEIGIGVGSSLRRIYSKKICKLS